MVDVIMRISLYDENDDIIEENVLYNVNDINFTDSILQVCYHDNKCNRKYNLNTDRPRISIWIE